MKNEATKHLMRSSLSLPLPTAVTAIAQSAHQEKKQKIRVGPCGLLGNGASPRAYGAKRFTVRIREKEGFKHPKLLRAPCFWGTHEMELHAVDTQGTAVKAFSLLRFFVAKDQEMTCRHTQWLIVIKKIANTKRAKTWKATTRH